MATQSRGSRAAENHKLQRAGSTIYKADKDSSVLRPRDERATCMSHHVDGFELKFTSRTSWKAELRFQNQKIVVPVTLTKGRRKGASSQEVFLEVWYRNADELRSRAADSNDFIVALAKAKDDHAAPPVFDTFVGLFRVIPTGVLLSETSIETKILERVRAQELAAV
jgi:hypothetical protein